ncbi:MAG: DUF4293 domain-containing protein [Alistipes sp.]|nr:DUF4293 domain-containing protein [Alistipes sp.]
MIQRIQSLYLLIVAALMAVMLFVPLAVFYAGQEQIVMSAFALRDGEGTVVLSAVYLGVLLAAVALLPLVTILLFRRRMTQIRLCIVEIVLLVGSLVMMGVYGYLAMQTVESLTLAASNFRFVVVFPLVAIIFVVLAARAIFKDELLVRSLDRIR